MSKGSKQRPTDKAKYSANWDSIFNKDKVLDLIFNKTKDLEEEFNNNNNKDEDDDNRTNDT